MSLPVELRVLIYKEILIPHNYWSPRYFVVRGPDSTKALSVTRSGRHIRRQEKVGYKHDTPPLAIAFTCRAVYLEASPIWYAAWTFKFLENGQMNPFIDAIGSSNCFGFRNRNAIKHALLQMDSSGEDLDETGAEMIRATIRLEGLRTLEFQVCGYPGNERWEIYKSFLRAICELSTTLQSAKLLGTRIAFDSLRDDPVRERLCRLTSNSWRATLQMTRIKPQKGRAAWLSYDGYYDTAYSRVVSKPQEKKFLKLLLELS